MAIVTGRSEKQREMTTKQLENRGVKVDLLWMKPGDGDDGTESFKRRQIRRVAMAYDQISFYENDVEVLEHLQRTVGKELGSKIEFFYVRGSDILRVDGKMSDILRASRRDIGQRRTEQKVKVSIRDYCI